MTEPALLPSGLPRIETLELRGIVKRFPGVLANDRVDFDVRAGEIHALLGENGAGKSTLMKILYGLYQPDAGEILLNGEPMRIHSPKDSIARGIGMIHQHFMLVDNLTVVENVALGLRADQGGSAGPLLDLRTVEQRIRTLTERYQLQVDPHAVVGRLAVGQQQRVEIIKALYRGGALLVLDEPTAVLTPQEVADFFVIMRQMAREGHALVFISHKLHEVLEITDRITVLRAGRVVGTLPTQETTRRELAQMMVGRAVGFERRAALAAEEAPGPLRLALSAVSAVDDRKKRVLDNVTLEVHAGEILGIAGVSGNGQRPLAEVITGLLPVQGGAIHLDNRDITHAPAVDRIAAGVGYIPEERMHDGVVKDFAVADNFILRDLGAPGVARRGFLQFNAIAHRARTLVGQFQVKTPSIYTPVKNLSGGNIQKLILARELSLKPRLLVAAQPTRGVDVGASEYIHAQLLEQRAAGTAILLISEDLDEVLLLADRIAVMYEGRIMDVLPRAEATAERLGLLMAGVADGA
jgi:simple sugar transport system ATP-binding protein